MTEIIIPLARRDYVYSFTRCRMASSRSRKRASLPLTADLSDKEILERLLALNLERAGNSE